MFSYSDKTKPTMLKLLELTLTLTNAPITILEEEFNMKASLVQNHKALQSHLAKAIMESYKTFDGYDNYTINLIVDSFLLFKRLKKV